MLIKDLNFFIKNNLSYLILDYNYDDYPPIPNISPYNDSIHISKMLVFIPIYFQLKLNNQKQVLLHIKLFSLHKDQLYINLY